MTPQATFRAALLDAARPAPPGLNGPGNRPAGRRFDVYRNNVAVSLARALEVAFPVVRRIVGPEFFAAMAGVHLRTHPPKSPLLMFYGEDMPAFLASFPPVAHLGYLPDVARLELARRHAYHAADAAPIRAEALAGTDLMASRFTLAPAVRMIRSPWPLHSIWRADEAPDRTAQDVLVTRPAFDPEVHLVPPGGALFIAALAAGQTLSEAVFAAGAGFDPGATLALLLGGGAFVDIRSGD